MKIGKGLGGVAVVGESSGSCTVWGLGLLPEQKLLPSAKWEEEGHTVAKTNGQKTSELEPANKLSSTRHPQPLDPFWNDRNTCPKLKRHLAFFRGIPTLNIGL